MAGTVDQRITSSWDDNAAPWADAVRSGAIPSRRAGTDAAVVDAVARLRPARVLDLGCGEGWLARRLAGNPGCHVTGVDGSAELIRLARAADPRGTYIRADYAAIAADPTCLGGPFDVAVANFALLAEDIGSLLRALPSGALVVQTVGGAYADGWREESFAGFGSGGWTPMPWYFRTLASWHADLAASGWRVTDLREPGDPETGRPLSLLMTCARIGVSRIGGGHRPQDLPAFAQQGSANHGQAEDRGAQQG
jgi:SAM-dependent methyltransferase